MEREREQSVYVDHQGVSSTVSVKPIVRQPLAPGVVCKRFRITFIASLPLNRRKEVMREGPTELPVTFPHAWRRDRRSS